MTDEDKALKFFVRYRSIFLFLGFILIAQLVLALKLVFIVENDTSSPKMQNPPLPIPQVGNLDDDNNIKTKLELKHSNSAMTEKSSMTGANSSDSKIPSPFLSPQSLNFVPNCEITGKEAISAIRRAKTQFCKEHLANITCQIAADNLYPKRLPRFCKRDDTTYMKHVGCFQDDKQNRLLSDHFVLLKETNSPDTCVDLCLQTGYPYAGVQYSVECFCGNLKPKIPTISDLSTCKMKCPLSTDDESDRDLTCGGYFLIDVYETGVFRENEVNSPVVDFQNASEELIAQASKTGTARIVFFLTLNGRALRQVIRLIKSLFHERHYFYIHVDARQDYMFRELLTVSYKLPNNIRFMRERKSTIWGGASLLKILLHGMNELVKNSKEWNWHWDYVINLSESDFPLKTTTQLETFLTLNKGKNFLKSHGRDVQNFILKQGLDKTFVECEYRMWRVGDRKLPAGILMDGGSDWIALHFDFVEYIVTSNDELLDGLLTIFEHTLLPGESFFHIVLRNSALCQTFIDNNLHVTNWKRKLGCKCQYKNIVDWCGCSPNNFRLSDWNRLEVTQSRLLFFGRKFEAVVNQEIINQLESFLYPLRSERNFPTFDRYWQSIYHHHDLTPKPDDSILTLGASLSRIAANFYFQQLLTSLKSDIGRTNLDIGSKLKEMSVYIENNQVSGIIIHFDILVGDALLVTMETWFKLQNLVSYEPWSDAIDKYHSRIQHIQVGSDYDQKEQLFRNFAGSVGPLSEPTLAYHVYADEALNFTFIWSNSLQVVHAVQNFSVESGVTANFAKPALKLPLTPGNWTAKVLSENGSLLAQTVFMVSLAEFYHGQPITETQNNILNVSPGEKSIVEEMDVVHWTPKSLHKRIDANTNWFYDLQETCLVSGLTKAGIMMLAKEERSEEWKLSFTESNVVLDGKRCTESPWSTVFPDSKSTITGIDDETGLLVP